MNEIELAWAAGFYDGEGSISCTSNNGNPQTRVQISIGQKNDGDNVAATLERFCVAVGVGKIYRKVRAGKEDNQHQYVVCKADDVQTVINKLWPYISRVKKAQIDRAVEKLYEGRMWLRAKQERERNE